MKGLLSDGWDGFKNVTGGLFDAIRTVDPELQAQRDREAQELYNARADSPFFQAFGWGEGNNERTEDFSFGKNYLIPKPFDNRLITEVPPAVAKAAIESGVAKEPITDWDAYKETLAQRLGTGSKLMRLLTSRAKADPKRVIFAEADHLNVLKAAHTVYEDGIAIPILLGSEQIIKELMLEINFDADLEIIDPKSDDEKERKERFAKIYWESRKRKGITYIDAQKLMRERNYFAAMMVNEGEADALVTGYSRSYPAVAKPMIELIGKSEGVLRVAATNIMMTSRGPMFFSDTAFNVNPTEEELVQIARMTNRVMKIFDIEPNLAMLSYSNFGSAKSKSASKVSGAVAYIHEHYPDIIIDGEIQADFAISENLRKDKFPFSKLHEKKVNGLIFPNLNSANIGYKLINKLNNIEKAKEYYQKIIFEYPSSIYLVDSRKKYRKLRGDVIN